MNERITRAIAEVQKFIGQVDDAYSLPVEAARFVHAGVLACRSTRCLEIGTSYGHSGLWIGAAAAQNGGTLITIDREKRKSDIAAGYFKEAGLEQVIFCRVGEAADMLSSLDGPFDWVLNDADKENCIRYVELIHDKLIPGGVVLTDNALSNHRVREEFVPWVRGDKRFISALIEVGNGIEFSVKVA